MTIFLINYVLVFVYWIFYREWCRKHGKSKKMLYLLMIIISVQMVLIIGLRDYSVGKDTISYARRFNKYRLYSLCEIFTDEFQEIGFSLLIKSVGTFTDNFQWFSLVVSILSIVPIMVIIAKCSKKPFLSVLLFIAFDYYAFMFSGMRQAVSYGLCFLSYLFTRDKKPIKFLIIVLLAAQFHKSAYLFLPAYMIAQFKADNKSIGLVVVLFAMAFVFKDKIYDFIENNLFSRYEDAYARTETNPFGIIVLILCITMIGILFKENAIKSDKHFNCCLMLLCAGAVLLPFISIGSNAKRIVEYYCMFLVLVIPGILDGIKDKRIYELANVGAVIVISGLFLRFLLVDGYNIVPYVPFYNI